MLYDPKWQKTEAKADPVTLTALIAWMENKNPSERYNYKDTRNCLIAQYFAHVLGFQVVTGNQSWCASCPLNIRSGFFPREWVEEIAKNAPHTFGAAIKRAKKLHDQ